MQLSQLCNFLVDMKTVCFENCFVIQILPPAILKRTTNQQFKIKPKLKTINQQPSAYLFQTLTKTEENACSDSVVFSVMTGLLSRLMYIKHSLQISVHLQEKFPMVLRNSARNISMKSHESLFKGSPEKLIRFSGFFNTSQTECELIATCRVEKKPGDS